MDEMAALVAGMSIFAKFTPEQKQRLVGFLSHNCYPSNHLLVQQDEAADSLWVLNAAQQGHHPRPRQRWAQHD